jgi:hypothetical protein
MSDTLLVCRDFATATNKITEDGLIQFIINGQYHPA